MLYFERSDDATRGRIAQSLIAAACAEFRFQMIEAEFVAHSENVVYRVTAQREGTRYEYALRISGPTRYTTAQLEAECRWIAAINRETSVAAPEPVATPDGRRVVEVPAPELSAPRRCAMFPWLRGEKTDPPRAEHLRALGVVTAALHNHADTYGPEAQVDRPAADWASLLAPFVRGEFVAAWEGYTEPVVTDEERRVYMQAAERLSEAIRRIPRDRDYGLIHADLHLWNVVYHDGAPRPIDFDDCHFAPYMTDVATTLWHHAKDAQSPALRDAYIEGYHTTRPTPSDWENQVAVFMAARCFSMMDWILGWRREDHMGSGSQAASNFVPQLRAYLDRDG
jgi:Ser/Thr protein kinase RdoA (MazF antagonist)